MRTPACRRPRSRMGRCRTGTSIRSRRSQAAPTPQWTVDAILELNGEVHDYTTTGAVKDLNSGGHVLLLSPGIRIAYGSVSGFALFGIPIINEMNGIQSKVDYRLFTGVTYAFEVPR